MTSRTSEPSMRFTEFEARVDFMVEDEVAEAARRPMALGAVADSPTLELARMRVHVAVGACRALRVPPGHSTPTISGRRSRRAVVTLRACELLVRPIERKARPLAMVKGSNEAAERARVVATRTAFTAIDDALTFLAVEASEVGIDVARLARAPSSADIAKGVTATTEAAPSFVCHHR